MRAFDKHSGRTSDKISQSFFRSRLLLAGTFLVFIVLVISAITVAEKSAELNIVATPVAAVSEPIPQVIVVGKRMTPEQKRQFDQAEAMAANAAMNEVAELPKRP